LRFPMPACVIGQPTSLKRERRTMPPSLALQACGRTRFLRSTAPMTNSLRTVVTFKSRAFNTSEPKGYFVNLCCFGDDLCRWLQQRLQSSGIPTSDELGQEDFGWYFTFQCGSQPYCFVVSYQPGDAVNEGQWIGEVERHVGFLASLLGGRQRGIDP